MPHNDRIHRIKDKLKTSGKVLYPCLTIQEVEKFETQHRIVLPATYRDFILSVGDGGEGPPCYGISQLGQTPDYWNAQQKAFWTELPHITEAFPFTKTWVWEDGDESNEGDKTQVDHGSLHIGNDGCGQYWRLIITGPERGNIWMACGEGIGPIFPRCDFLKMYEEWLDGRSNWFQPS